MQAPSALKGLVLIFALCMAVRLVSTACGGADSVLSGLISGDQFACSILSFELSPSRSLRSDSSLAALIFSRALGAKPPEEMSTPTDAKPTAETATPFKPESIIDVTDSGLYYDLNVDAETDELSKADVVTQPVSSASDTITIDNKSIYAIDTDAMLKEPLNILLSGDSPAVLIIHTHGSEAYMPDGNDIYEESDPYRTQEKIYSVVRVGDELAAEFAKKGIAIIHDRNIYDFPSYRGSYTRSYDAIQTYLEKYPSIKIVIDLHRDAIEAADGTVYKTIAHVGDVTCSQILLVMGTNSSGLVHPNWRENLKLALHLQSEMDTLYPSLAKPIEISQYRYNQQATTGSMLIEVGCTGNTLQESIAAIRYFADAASKVLLDLYD